MNNIANDNSGKPDALKGARPVWGWGRAVTHALHHDKNSIISNCHIQVMFPPNRLETAKYISQVLGEATVVERQYSVSGKRAGMLHGQVTESMQANKRPLLTPDEVMALPGPKKNSVGDIEEPGEMIVRVAGAAPIRGVQPLYFFDDVFLARAKVPAPLESDRMGIELKEATAVQVPDDPAEDANAESDESGGESSAPDGESRSDVADVEVGNDRDAIAHMARDDGGEAREQDRAESQPEPGQSLELERSHEIPR